MRGTGVSREMAVLFCYRQIPEYYHSRLGQLNSKLTTTIIILFIQKYVETRIPSYAQLARTRNPAGNSSSQGLECFILYRKAQTDCWSPIAIAYISD